MKIRPPSRRRIIRYFPISTAMLRHVSKLRYIIVTAALLAAPLGGCSIARVAYNNADWLVLRQMDAYLDLSSEQKTAATKRLKRRLETHRLSELPAYGDYLRRVRGMAIDGLSPVESDWIVERGYALVRATIGQTIPEVAPSLADLSEHQIKHLEMHLLEVNQEFRQEYLPEPKVKRLARRYQRAVERIEHWTGALRQDQRQLLESYTQEFPDSAESWLAFNVSRQQALLQLLRRGAGRESLENFLNHWWIELRGRPPELKRMNDRALDGIKRLIVSVDATLDATQRTFLLWRLQNYIEELDALLRRRK